MLVPIFNTVPAPLLVSSVLTPNVPNIDVIIPALPILKLVAVELPSVSIPALATSKIGQLTRAAISHEPSILVMDPTLLIVTSLEASPIAKLPDPNAFTELVYNGHLIRQKKLPD